MRGEGWRSPGRKGSLEGRTPDLIPNHVRISIKKRKRKRVEVRPGEGHRAGGRGAGKWEDFDAATAQSLKSKREENDEKGPDHRKVTFRLWSLGLLFLGQGL